MSLTIQQLLDVVKATRETYLKSPNGFVDLAMEKTQYFVMYGFAKRYKKMIEGGISVSDLLMTSFTNNARFVNLFENDVLNQGNVLTKLNIEWKHLDSHHMYDRREVELNKAGANQLVNIINVRRRASMLGIVEKMENSFWDGQAGNAKAAWGLPDWVVKSTTGTAEDFSFNGLNPTTASSGIGGINSTTQPRWRNGTGIYSAVTYDEFLRKLVQRAFRKMNFQSPMQAGDYSTGNGAQFQCFTNDNVMTELERIAHNNNEDYGRELLGPNGQLVVKGCPVYYVPKLDEDTDDPFYMLDWDTLFYLFDNNGDFHEDPPMQLTGVQHNTVVAFTDATFNFGCNNRRCNTVLHKAA